MKILKLACTGGLATIFAGALLAAPVSRVDAQDQDSNRPVRVLRPNAEAAVTYAISQFELSYKKRDRVAMRKMLLPTKDGGLLKRRVPWFGVGEQSGSTAADNSGQESTQQEVQPKLFDSPEAAFRLTRYGIQKINQVDPNHWTATVKEVGTMPDSNGQMRVKRVRQFDAVRVNNHWYIEKYYAKDSPDEFGFAVNRDYDTVTPM